MSDPHFRVTRKVKEIRAVLASVEPYSELTLWINPDDRRLVFQGNLIKIDQTQEMILLQLKSAPQEIREQSHVYLRFTEHSGVSKCKVISVQGSILALQISDEMIVIERRRNRRIQFRQEDEKKITLALGKTTQDFIVLNASLKGFRVLATPAQVIEGRTAKALHMSALGSVPIELECRFVWNDEKTLALELSRELSASEFDFFIENPRRAGVDPEKFFHDQDYFETVRSNMDDIIKKLEKRPKLATAMKTLQVNRDGNYLKTHIDVLCYVSCSIGRMLGWVTQKTLDKLILAAYLHDIRYFEHPKLARISSLADFHSLKGNLTEEEQKIFLEGPSYSARMAKDEASDSLDAERILIQQKERPDGTGFPEGVDFKHLYPLSCLFMVSHEFVDYVYSTPNWNFRDFTVKARTVFKGPYFIKILEIFDQLS
jgi:HD-GYP domain-containing protein (c-di-GMP phosphodiesterase class II)